MKPIRFIVLVAALLGLAACGTPSKFKTYNGPEVTRVIVNKGGREMFLMHHDRVLKSHKVDLGFAPKGHKEFEGDGKTPEGEYTVDRRNPDSSFHLSLGISYPNEQDIAFAEAAGKEPGGDIFIHGEPNKLGIFGPDWTAGCISVTNPQIERLYAMVRDGTPVTINP